MQLHRSLVRTSMAVGAVWLGGCEARVQLAEPAAATGEPAILTVTVADTALAGRAGWSPGVGGTEVFVRRDEDPVVDSLATDSEGRLSLANLPAADYWVWAQRHVAAAELDTPVLAPPALAGGRRADFHGGSETILELHGQSNGSLVISEFYYHLLPYSVFGQGVNYHFHWYIELYNNSDTTVYLDGKIVGDGFNYPVDAALWPCSETAEFRDDPRGIWSQRFQAFPGSGREHPLAPHRAVVIAEQAIDHSTVYLGLPDLNHADFQFYWSSRALNPAVPTMLPIQLSTGVMQTMFLNGPEVPFVAEAVDITTLERKTGRYQGEFALFPRAAILDVAVLYPTNYLGPALYDPLCPEMVAPSLDALGAFVRPQENRGDEHLLAAQRKLLPDGIHLQRTEVAAADWKIGPRSPGMEP